MIMGLCKALTTDFRKKTSACVRDEPMALATASATLLTMAMYHLLSS